MFALAGFEDAEAQAEAVFDVETRIAAHHWDRVRLRNLRAMYNPMPLADVVASSPGFDWDAYLAGAGIDLETLGQLIVSQPSFVEGAAPLLTELPLEAWHSWARWKAISGLSGYLSSPFVDARFDFYERTLSGNEEQRPRWKRGVALVEGALGEAVGRAYVARHFQPEKKEAMDRLVARLLEARSNAMEENA